jgi:hypothetical protein
MKLTHQLDHAHVQKQNALSSTFNNLFEYNFGFKKITKTKKTEEKGGLTQCSTKRLYILKPVSRYHQTMPHALNCNVCAAAGAKPAAQERRGEASGTKALPENLMLVRSFAFDQPSKSP